MEYHEHVTTRWPRCSLVELQGENVVCTLDWQRSYDLTDDRRELHVRFVSLKTDNDLLGFVRTWGPLWLEVQGNLSGFHRAQYWAFREKLVAELELVQGLKCGDKARLQTALLKYIAAADAFSRTLVDVPGDTAVWLSLSLFGIDSGVNLEDWIPKAEVSGLREAAAVCMGFYSLGFSPHATWRNGKLQIAWKPSLSTLADVIEWGLWKSLTGARPVTICEECRTFFVPDSAHPRKFCSYRCAHRVAMRMWREHNAEGLPKQKRGKHAKAAKA